MELKYYEKPWLPAFKGAFLILFGIIDMLRIVGSVRALVILFIVLIGMTSILLISSGILFRKTTNRAWTIGSGFINLAFCIYLGTHTDAPRDTILWIILVWLVFYGFMELIEAALLFARKNAFAALFLLNALLTLLFGFFLRVLLDDFTSRGVFLLGLLAFIFGIANLLSAFLLSRIKAEA